jgi:hypothetical protein
MQKRLLALMIVGGAMVAGAAPFAGELFRLEIGPPIAGGFSTKKAVLVARPLCCDPATVRITATAEGIVNGTRRSIPVEVQALAAPGVHAIPRQWPDGQWVLNLTGTCAERGATASAVVPLTATGFDREKTQILTRAATGEEIETALRGAPALARTTR